MRRARRLIVWALSPVFLYLTLAVVGALVPALRDDVGPQKDDAWIILAQGPIHYDILLPLDDETRATFAFVARDGVPIIDPDAKWLSVGWGSAAFYTSTASYADLSFKTVLKAATGDDSVLRFAAYGSLPNVDNLHRIPVSTAQLEVLRERIRSGLAVAPTPIPEAGLAVEDVFYPAKGRFNILQTCNDWVGQKLSSAGLNFGIWTPTPFAVTLSIWWNGLKPD